jgi:hypothetical protein
VKIKNTQPRFLTLSGQVSAAENIWVADQTPSPHAAVGDKSK